MHIQSIESSNTYAVVGMSIMTLLASESKYLLMLFMDTYHPSMSEQIRGALDTCTQLFTALTTGFRYCPYILIGYLLLINQLIWWRIIPIWLKFNQIKRIKFL